MKKILKPFVIFLLMISLVGCENTSKQDIGTMTGAVAGGLIGSRFGGGSGNILAIGAGAVAGAIIGNAIGKSMDTTDKLKMTQALETHAVERHIRLSLLKMCLMKAIPIVENIKRRQSWLGKNNKCMEPLAGNQMALGKL
jgi:uncharacterized protein YcfJ